MEWSTRHNFIMRFSYKSVTENDQRFSISLHRPQMMMLITCVTSAVVGDIRVQVQLNKILDLVWSTFLNTIETIFIIWFFCAKGYSLYESWICSSKFNQTSRMAAYCVFINTGFWIIWILSVRSVDSHLNKPDEIMIFCLSIILGDPSLHMSVTHLKT